MEKSDLDRPSRAQPAQIIPTLRGLLANPTGDPDIPWEPVILKAITGKEALDFARDEANASSSHYPKPLKKRGKPPIQLLISNGRGQYRMTTFEAALPQAFSTADFMPEALDRFLESHAPSK